MRVTAAEIYFTLFGLFVSNKTLGNSEIRLLYSNMNIYCFQCGSPSPKTANFCGSCGTAFNSKKTTVTAKVAPKLEIDDENDNPVRIPDNLDGLDVEIVKPASLGVSFGSVIEGAISDPVPNPVNRPKNKKLSKKAAMEQFRKEAGNSRISTNVGGEH